MITRIITNQIADSIKAGRVVGIFGPRRSGKTTLMNLIKEKIGSNILMVHGENLDAAEILSSQRTSVLKRFIGNNKCLFIDEAQEIPDIGVNLKLIVDTIPEVAVLVSGSSGFDLRKKIGEPLVGRIQYFYLYQFSLLETNAGDYLKQKETLEDQLIFGFYPQVYCAQTVEEKKIELQSIRDGYLLKDILKLDNLKDSLFIFNLLRLLAFQIGNDISYSELASNLGVNKKTVVRYLELLEKSYVLFSHSGFSRNLRKEYSKSPRYYFWDNGIRNSVISNYNRPDLRDDTGQLWENFFISERIKYMDNKQISANRFFWRTYEKKEIDLIEEREGKLFAYECKYSKKAVKMPKDFIQSYPESQFFVVTKDNYLDFLT